MISIVIPCYNESDVLDALFERVQAVGETLGRAYEVILVDDGSTDDTRQRIAALHEKDARWKILALSRNFGHQTAVSAGIHYAQGDAVIVMDGDLQDPPELIPQLIATWEKGSEVVYAVRRTRKESWWLRTAYKTFYRILARASAIHIPLDSGDFCLMDRSVVNVLRAMPERCRFVRGMRSWAGFRQTGLEYDRDERQAGASKYTFRKLLRLALDGMVSFSYAPLKLASWMGFTVSFISGLVLIFLLFDAFFQFELFGLQVRDVQGRASFLAGILFIGGAQLLVLGILGEYLGRVFDETKSRPPWVIAQSNGIEAPEEPERAGWFVPPTGKEERHG